MASGTHLSSIQVECHPHSSEQILRFVASATRTNGLAIASLVLSLTVFLIGPILAIIFGLIARRQIRESKGGETGDGLALAGLIIGIVELAISLVVVIVVVVLIANGSFSELGQHELAIGGAPGYTTTTGESGRPLAEGSPWGRPCQPIVFQVNSSMPAQQYELIRQSVEGARALGLDVTIETQGLIWYPSLLYPAGQTNATVQVVPIFPSTETPPEVAGRSRRTDRARMGHEGVGRRSARCPDGSPSNPLPRGRARRCPSHRAGRTSTRCLQSGRRRVDLSWVLDYHRKLRRVVQPPRRSGHAADVRMQFPADNAPWIACVIARRDLGAWQVSRHPAAAH